MQLSTACALSSILDSKWPVNEELVYHMRRLCHLITLDYQVSHITIVSATFVQFCNFL
jgi:hypothetical protein